MDGLIAGKEDGGWLFGVSSGRRKLEGSYRWTSASNKYVVRSTAGKTFLHGSLNSVCTFKQSYGLRWGGIQCCIPCGLFHS